MDRIHTTSLMHHLLVLILPAVDAGAQPKKDWSAGASRGDGVLVPVISLLSSAPSLCRCKPTSAIQFFFETLPAPKRVERGRVKRRRRSCAYIFFSGGRAPSHNQQHLSKYPNACRHIKWQAWLGSNGVLSNPHFLLFRVDPDHVDKAMGINCIFVGKALCATT